MHNCPRTLGEHGCAECLRNRTYHKRVWSHRIDLESRLHVENSFLTLTYSDEYCPPDGSLRPRDVVLFLKRLRALLAPTKFRYFFVGEYGDDTLRPHYHAALFGIGQGQSELVTKAWGLGHIMLAELNIATIRYITGYVTKKMTVKDDPRLLGKYPEFTRMSRMPALGSGFLPTIATALDSEAGAELLLDDVPKSLRLHGRNMPLGRTLRNKLRKEIYGITNPLYLESETLFRSFIANLQAEEDLQALFNDYENSSMSKKMTFIEYLKQVRSQKFRNAEAQFKLTKKGSL